MGRHEAVEGAANEFLDAMSAADAQAALRPSVSEWLLSLSLGDDVIVLWILQNTHTHSHTHTHTHTRKRN